MTLIEYQVTLFLVNILLHSIAKLFKPQKMSLLLHNKDV